MLEVDFFGLAHSRSPAERREKLAVFDSDSPGAEDFLNYGFNYYDNAEYGIGYGGYSYDGRYEKCVEGIIEYYQLKLGSKVLDIGCAKGFILFEFLKQGMNITGIDISGYAIENAKLETKPYLIQRSCEVLPWDSNSFDFVYSKETLPHLTKKQLGLAISEIERVAKGNNIFLEIGVSESDRGKEMMKAWDKTHQTIRSSDWWRGFLRGLNFKGQVNFKILF